jgi:HAD superfamily phosphatase (TIGR01668 family)
MVKQLKKKKSFYEKFIPTSCANTVFDIDYEALYRAGKRYILTDVDNTLISYQETLPDEATLSLRKELSRIGYSVYVISNNHGKRIANFAMAFDAYGYVSSAHKPLKFGFKRSLKQMGNPRKREVLVIGDQLMTDVFGARRMGLDVILVKPLKLKTEKWFTKINRKLENKVLRELKNINSQKYQEIMELKVTKHD